MLEFYIMKALAIICAFLFQNCLAPDIPEPTYLYNTYFDCIEGVVIDQSFEGYSLENDIYTVQYMDGTTVDIIADDLCIGDTIESWFMPIPGNYTPLRTIYLYHEKP